jgi:hypothetical protein
LTDELTAADLAILKTPIDLVINPKSSGLENLLGQGHLPFLSNSGCAHSRILSLSLPIFKPFHPLDERSAWAIPAQYTLLLQHAQCGQPSCEDDERRGK